MNKAEAQAKLIDIVVGYQHAQVLHVAAVLGLADHLSAGPQPLEALAQATGTHASTLGRLLRALISLGIFAHESDGRFAMTVLAEPLRSDVPGSLRAHTMYFVDGACWAPWGDLLESVKTGKSAFERVFGVDPWQYRAERPALNDTFNLAMADHSRVFDQVIVSSPNLAGIGCLVDVGGGRGTLLARLLQKYPTMRGVLFDQAHVVESAGDEMRSAGVADRCEIVAGDFFDALPQGKDVYLLRQVLHDWDDEKSIAILKSCRRAMTATSKVIVIERVLPSSNPRADAFLDLQMLLIHGGCERTEAEYIALYRAAGLAPGAIRTMFGGIRSIEGVPA